MIRKDSCKVDYVCQWYDSSIRHYERIVPKTIVKEVKSTLNITKKKTDDDIKMQDIPDEIEKLKALMKVASGQLDFERAIEIREKIAELKNKLRRAGK